MANDRANGTASGRLRALVAMATLVTVALASSPAVAQEQPGDPYGPTTTTDPTPGPTPVCAVAEVELEPGTTVVVALVDVPPAQEVIVLLGGIEVARDVAPEGPGPTSLELSFVVPELPSGQHRLDAVGASFTVGCGADGFVSVLGAEVAPVDREALPRTDPATGPGADPGSGGLGGALPRTGTSIALLLAVALVLVLAGRVLLARARRRRRRHRRTAPGRSRELAPH